MPYQDSPEGRDHSSASSEAPNPPKARTYAETVNHHYLLFQDTDLVNGGRENGRGVLKSRTLSSGTVGHCEEWQCKGARLRSCWLSLSPLLASPGFLPRSAPQGANAAHAGRRGAFAALPGQAAARGYSQGTNLVSHLLHPSSLSLPAASGPTVSEMGDEKVAEGRKEDSSGNLIP